MNKMIREKHLYTYPIKIKNPIKISILYPNTYFIGMSNLGFQALYHNFNMNSNYKLSRFFFDKNRENSIYSPDKEFNLNQSDIILISQSFELDIFNIFKMLINNNIEPYKSLRKQKPIIGIGGIFPTINPYIYKDIMDIIFKGELENYINNIHEILNTYHSVLNNEIVDYINENLSKFETSSVYTINKDSIPIHSAILSNHTSFKDMLLIEISRGCKYNCSFCLVTNIYKKYRCYYIDRIIQIVKKGLYYTNKIGLVSALTTEYPQLKELVNKINKLGGTVSFSSLRVDQIDDELYNLMKINSQHTLTIAPESSSKKIKKNIGKDINNDKIFRIVEKSPKYGIKKIKIYFIIGFENETDEDIMKNIQFIKKVKETLLHSPYKKSIMPKIIISLSIFIPKPWTIMSKVKMLDIKSVKNRIRKMKRELIPLGGISINYESPQLSRVQALISNGNFDLGNHLVEIVKQNKNIKQIIKFKERSKNI